MFMKYATFSCSPPAQQRLHQSISSDYGMYFATEHKPIEYSSSWITCYTGQMILGMAKPVMGLYIHKNTSILKVNHIKIKCRLPSSAIKKVVVIRVFIAKLQSFSLIIFIFKSYFWRSGVGEPDNTTDPVSKVQWANMGPPGSCRSQMSPMLAPWTLLSGDKLQATHICWIKLPFVCLSRPW